MAIQKVSVSTQPHNIPVPKSREVIPEIDDLPPDVTEENLIELDYVYDVNAASGPNVFMPQIDLAVPETKENTYYRYPTLSFNFSDKHTAPDPNGIEKEPIFDKTEYKSLEQVSRIVLPAASAGGNPTWDWSAEHAQQVWDDSVKSLKEDLKAIGDRAKDMGKDVVNSLFGFHPLPDNYVENLPNITAQMYGLAYAPFMPNTAKEQWEKLKKPAVAEEDAAEKQSFVKKFLTDVANKALEGQYPLYPTFEPEVYDVVYPPMFMDVDKKDSTLVSIENMNRAEAHIRAQRVGLYFRNVNKKTEVLLASVAFTPILNRFYARLGYDVSKSAGLWDYPELSTPVRDDLFYRAAQFNQIGFASTYLRNKIENGEGDNLVTYITNHFQKLAFFPLSYNKDGKYIIPKIKVKDNNKERDWIMPDFYDLDNTKESLSGFEDFLTIFYNRISWSNFDKKTKWDYTPYKVMDIVKQFVTSHNIVTITGTGEKEVWKPTTSTKENYSSTKEKYTRIKFTEDNKGTVSPLSPSANGKNFSPYAMIERIGPDFMKHKFDAYFLWDIFGADERKEWDKIVETYKWLTDFEKFALSKKGFAVRLGQITIPKVANDEFSLQFLETEVRKVKSTKAISNQSSFTLRLDQNLFWLDMINTMAGHMNTIDEQLLISSEFHPYIQAIKRTPEITKTPADPLRWRSVLKLIARSWSPGSISNKYNIKDSELCLVVKMSHLSNWVNTKRQQKTLPYFVFENVRILGTSDKIQYSKEANIQNITVNFIFKRCYEIMLGYETTDQFSEENEFVRTTNSMKETADRNFTTVTSKGKQFNAMPPIVTYEKDNLDWMNTDKNAAVNLPIEMLRSEA